jgi:hypothetical protein
VLLVPNTSVIWGEAAYNYKLAIGATPVQQCRTHLTVVESGVGVTTATMPVGDSAALQCSR